MAKNKNTKQRQLGKKQHEKKKLIPDEYKNSFWTIVVIVVLIIFFIVNNTRDVPEEGPYPPNYNPAKADSILNQTLNQ